MDNTLFCSINFNGTHFQQTNGTLGTVFGTWNHFSTLLEHLAHFWHTLQHFCTLLAHYFEHFSTILVQICVKSIKHGKYWILKYRTPEQNAKIVSSGKS